MAASALLLGTSSPAQPLPGTLDQMGLPAYTPAPSRTTDDSVSRRGGAPGQQSLDSLELEAAMLDVERAEVDASASSLWRRMIPRINLSASLGLQDALLRDPESDAVTFLPRDSYRLTVAIGLDQLFNSADHDRALLRLKKARLDVARAGVEIARRRDARAAGEAATLEELSVLREELALLRHLVAYNEILFSEGKAEFDALARARLQLLNLSRVITQVSQRLLKSD